MTKAFSLRISEALAVEEDDFFGAEYEAHIDMKNDFIRELKDRQIAALFLMVHKAEKKKVSQDLIRILGEQDKNPKSGPYTACCTNKGMAQLHDHPAARFF